MLFRTLGLMDPLRRHYNRMPVLVGRYIQGKGRMIKLKEMVLEFNKLMHGKMTDDDHDWPAMEVTLEEYLALWKPWCWVLIVKLLSTYS